MDFITIIIILFLILGGYGVSKLVLSLLPKNLKQNWIFNIVLITVYSLIILFIYATPNKLRSGKSSIEDKDSVRIKKERVAAAEEIACEEGCAKRLKLYERIVFSVPDTMNKEQTYTVKLTIEGDTTINESNASASADTNGKQFQGDDRKKSDEKQFRKVRVFLDGVDFNIVPFFPYQEEQTVHRRISTSWMWHVTPKKNGEKRRVLNVKVEVKRGDNFICVYGNDEGQREVVINKLSLGKYLEQQQEKFDARYILTVLIIPLVTWGYKKLSDRKNRKKQTEDKK